jgi:DNA-binding protein Fis
MSKKNIEECVRLSLEGYFKDLRGTEPAGLYDMMVGTVEKPMLEVVISMDVEDSGARVDAQVENIRLVPCR